MATGGLPTLKGVRDTRPVTKEFWYDPIKEIYHVDFKRWDSSYFSDMKTYTDILTSAD